MNRELSDYYFSKALDAARDDDLTKAISYSAISLGLNNDNDNSRKLSGLCYYRLGNYMMVESIFNRSEYYIKNLEHWVLEKKDKMNELSQLSKNLKYKKAIKRLRVDSDKSVSEYNYLGCLYAIMHKQDKAVHCFLEALKMDTSNSNTLLYLKNIQGDRVKRWWKKYD